MPTFDLKDYPKVIVHLQRGMEQAQRRGLYSAALRIVQLIQSELIPAAKPPPVSSGTYKAAWRAEATAEGYDVVNTLPYASIIDRGARAENIKVGRAMIEALTRWVELKGLAGKGSGRAEKAEQIAWAIAMDMKKRGIFNGGKGMRIAEQAAARAGAIVAQEIALEVRRENGGR